VPLTSFFDLGEFIPTLWRLYWFFSRILLIVDYPNAHLSPRHSCAQFRRNWPRRPTPLLLRPFITAPRSCTKDRKGVQYLRLVLLYTVYYPIIIGDYNYIDFLRCRRRELFSGDLPTSYSGELPPFLTLYRWIEIIGLLLDHLTKGYPRIRIRHLSFVVLFSDFKIGKRRNLQKSYL
jgi:hypothetical protein